ncbi:MAG: hypothetical protein KKE17_14940 [Proteobacteria bacterium]|nr:hypothetical protein [Pseudomonadota bacterium]MBU1711294.1 hypothetical protein [Pseudomonadota bacterium]
MLIDWTTVFFQIVNFLILIVLLKRFLYGPIIKAMDAREKTIAAGIAAAARAEQEGRDYALRLAADQKDFGGKRELMQQEAGREIEQWKQESVDRLKAEIAAQQKNWQQNLEDEQEAFLKKLKVTISRQVFDISRKVLADLADNNLESRLIEIFLDKINREISSPPEQDEHLTIISGFPLGNAQKTNLQDGLKKFFPGQKTIDFREQGELGFGIRLLVGDRKWEWNLSRYMNDMEDEIIRTMMAS